MQQYLALIMMYNGTLTGRKCFTCTSPYNIAGDTRLLATDLILSVGSLAIIAFTCCIPASQQWYYSLYSHPVLILFHVHYRCCLAGLAYPSGNITSDMVALAKTSVSMELSLPLWMVVAHCLAETKFTSAKHLASSLKYAKKNYNYAIMQSLVPSTSVGMRLTPVRHYMRVYTFWPHSQAPLPTFYHTMQKSGDKCWGAEPGNEAICTRPTTNKNNDKPTGLYITAPQ